MTSKVAHLAERRVRYLDSGGGRALVLLHAFPLSADQWLPQVLRAPPGWRVIAPDLRGFRNSTLAQAESLPARVTMEVYAADVFALMDHLEIRDACVAGVSMGGYIAFAMVQQAPQRVTGLVLAHTRATPDTPEGRTNRDKMIDLVKRDGAESVARAMLPKLLGETAWREQPDLVDAVGQMIRANTPEAIAGALGALRDRPDRTPLLKSISCPTLIIAGEEDTIIPRTDAGAMHEGIGQSQLVVLPRAGHLGNLEAPAAFNEAMYGFLTD